MNTSIETAVATYLNRKNRNENPTGKFDNAGRFYLDASEHRECCEGLRSPSRAFPYSQMVHGRTAKHVAHLLNVDERDLKRAARQAS
jgi:hypothetical protein